MTIGGRIVFFVVAAGFAACALVQAAPRKPHSCSLERGQESAILKSW
jgi:hypothetical protein